MRFEVLALTAALIGAVPAVASSSETFSASFLQADGGVSAGAYHGSVQVTVYGVGNSSAGELNDAFYIFDDGQGNPIGPGHDGSYYQLTFGTSTLVGLNPGQDAVNFIPSGLPSYNSDHIYTFVLNTGAVAPTQLHFGVSDGIFSDNGGQYTIQLTQLGAPEPTSWALMLLGVGGVGAALRRRKVAVSA